MIWKKRDEMTAPPYWIGASSGVGALDLAHLARHDGEERQQQRGSEHRSDQTDADAGAVVGVELRRRAALSRFPPVGGMNPAIRPNEIPNTTMHTGHDQMQAIQIRRRNVSVGVSSSGSGGTVVDIVGFLSDEQIHGG